MYFSLSTITTTGYGDLTAASPFGRLLAMAEAVTGQVYLVTFVAMLVGLFAANRIAGRPAVADGPEPAPPTDDPSLRASAAHAQRSALRRSQR